MQTSGNTRQLRNGKKGICKYYAAGKCKKGKDCDFEDVEQNGTVAAAQPSSRSQSKDGKKKKKKKGKSRSASRSKVSAVVPHQGGATENSRSNQSGGTQGNEQPSTLTQAAPAQTTNT